MATGSQGRRYRSPTRQWWCRGALIVVLTLGIAWGADDENLGRLAAERGEYDKALAHYLTALENAPENSKEEFRLQQKVIKLYAKQEALPEIPAEAKSNMFRGQQQLNDITYDGHWRTAMGEFQNAQRLAPWWPVPYPKLAEAAAGARQYAKAIRNLELYLLAAPKAPDAKQIELKLQMYKELAANPPPPAPN